MIAGLCWDLVAESFMDAYRRPSGLFPVPAHPRVVVTSMICSGPPRHPDEETNFRHLAKTGSTHYLAVHFGDPDTTVIDGKLYVSPDIVSNIKGLRAPDMLIAFGTDPEACARCNAYVIAEQGKLPDFVMEVASRSTGYIDVAERPADYAALDIPEYWRFDETGEHYGVRLVGDRLVGDRYEPIEIVDLPDGGLEGYSEALDLKLRSGDS